MKYCNDNSQALDDYISKLESDNEIYVESELDYANKCHKLEEELGCPLEVRCKVVTDSVIYDENGIEYRVVNTYMDYFDCENPFDDDMWYCDLCSFSWVDYKKTWWLKEDKSE